MFSWALCRGLPLDEGSCLSIKLLSDGNLDAMKRIIKVVAFSSSCLSSTFDGRMSYSVNS